jgi:hypothetical protein
MTSGSLRTAPSGQRRAVATAPWTSGSMGRSGLLMALGALIWFLGWYQLSGKATSDEQTAPLNIAILGVLIAAAGQLGWVLDGRRAVGQRRQALLEDTPDVEAAPTSTESRRAAGEPQWAGGGRYYHRSDCALSIGRQPAMASRDEHEAAGRSACGVCAP